MSLTLRSQQRHLSGITHSFPQQQDNQINSKQIQESKISSPQSFSEQSSPLTMMSNQNEKKIDAKNFLIHSGSPYNAASASSLSSRTTHQNIPTATTIHHQQSIQQASNCQIPTQDQIMGISLSSQPFTARIPLNTSRHHKLVTNSKIQEEPDDSHQQICWGQDISYKVEVEQQINFEGAEDSPREEMSLENRNQSGIAARSVNTNGTSIFKPSIINEHIIDESTKTQENNLALQLFWQHPPLVKLESILIAENKGDQQLSMSEDSSYLLSLMQSSMWESAKINERGKGSFFKNPNTAKLTKRLLDLQEPRGNIEEEEESEIDEDLIIQKSQNLPLISQDTNYLTPNIQINQNNQICQTCGNLNPLKETPDGTIILFDELELLNNVEEFSSHQKPPSMTSLNNLQLNRDWSNSKTIKPLNRYSSISVDATTREISASEINSNHRNSFSQQLKDRLTIPNTQYEKSSLFHLEQHSNDRDRKQTQGNNCKGCQDSNVKFYEDNNSNVEKFNTINNLPLLKIDEKETSSYASESIPDEPDRKQIFQTRSVMNRKIGSQKQISNIIPGASSTSSSSPNDNYFIPELLRSFSSPQDHYSNLFHQYFQKMHSNFQIKLSIENLYQQISPVILPPIENNKKTIFFDLDETLVHCIDIFTTPAQLASFTQSSLYTNKNSNHIFPLNTESCNETFCTIRFSQTEHIQCLISIRPYVQEMLEELAKDFELILLTAARQIYADAVLEKLDPEKKLFSHRFYRECCLEFQLPGQKSSSKNYLKDLRIFQNRKSENVILVDNSPLSFSNQINNGVPVLDYCNNHKADSELQRLTLFLKSLAQVPDVRQHIQRKFLLNDYKAFKEISRLQEYLQTELSSSYNN